MASPAWLPQEAKPPVSGETSLPMASPTPNSAHATPSTGKPTLPLCFRFIECYFCRFEQLVIQDYLMQLRL